MARAAFSDVITAVPAEPVKPVMYAIIVSCVRRSYCVRKSYFDADLLLQCILTDDCPLMVQLEMMNKNPFIR